MDTAEAGAATSTTTSSGTTSAASSPAATEAPTAPTERATPVSRLKELREAKAPGRAAASDRDGAGRFAPPSTGDSKSGARPEADGESAPAEAAQKTIPAEALRQRLEREKTKQGRLSERASAAELKASRAEAAYRLLSERNAELEAALREGRPYDERENALSARELALKARAQAEAVQRAHAEGLRSATTAEEDATLAEEMQTEIADAASAHPLVHPQEVFEALTRNPAASAADVAAAIQKQKLSAARARGLVPAEAPVAPSTARSASGGALPQSHPLNREGMAARLAELRNRNQGP